MLQVAAVIFGEDHQCWSVQEKKDGRDVFLLCWPDTLCSADKLLKRTRENSSLEEDGINALCPLIGQCVAESVGGALIRERR